MSCLERKFYLTIVRHGQTTANVSRTIQGHSNTPLTSLGFAQAEALARYFKLNKARDFNRVYSSDLGRARETCEIIIEARCREEHPPIRLDSRLRERKYGPAFEGKPIADLQAEAYKFGYNATNFTQYTPDGVESMESVKRRVADFCHDVLCRDFSQDEEVLVVSHWATIKELLKLFRPLARGAIRDEHLVETPNVAFSRFKFVKSDLTQARTNLMNGFSPIPGDNNMLALDIQVICLHQTPHLSSEQNSVNIKHRLE